MTPILVGKEYLFLSLVFKNRLGKHVVSVFICLIKWQQQCANKSAISYNLHIERVDIRANAGSCDFSSCAY